MEERYPDQRCHSILGETVSVSNLGVGGIIGDLWVPPFESPDFWLSPVSICAHRTFLKNRVKQEKCKMQDMCFRFGLFGVFLALGEMRYIEVEEHRLRWGRESAKGTIFTWSSQVKEGTWAEILGCTNKQWYLQHISKLCKSLPWPLDSKMRNRFKKKLSDRWSMEHKGRDSSYCSGSL